MRTFLAIAVWLILVTVASIFLFPIVAAAVASLVTIQRDDPHFQLKILMLTCLIPSGLLGFAMGVITALPFTCSRPGISLIPALSLLLFYLVYQQFTYPIDFPSGLALQMLLSTWIPLLAFAYFGGIVTQKAKDRMRT